MKISIIIPCYNVVNYISTLLGSILEQIENKDVEVICVNDGSIDQTLSVLRSFALGNSQLHVINQNNGGPAVARNTGLNIAKGDYIWFIDGDDMVDSNAIEVLLREISVKPTDVICFDYLSVDENGGLVPSDKRLKYDYQHIFKGTEAYAKFNIPSYLWNRIIRRDLIEKYHVRFAFRPEDEDFLINIYLVAESFRFINFHLYMYNDVEGSFSKSVENHYYYYKGYFLIMEKYRKFTRKVPDSIFWHKFVWTCLKNIIINYNRVKIGNYRERIDDRLVMYAKIREHLSIYEECISSKDFRTLFISHIKYVPFLLDLPCYFVYKLRIKHG